MPILYDNYTAAECCEILFSENNIDFRISYYAEIFALIEEYYNDDDFVREAVLKAARYFKNSHEGSTEDIVQGFFRYLRGVLRKQSEPQLIKARGKLVNFSKSCFGNLDIAGIECQIDNCINELLELYPEEQVCDILNGASQRVNKSSCFEEVIQYLAS